MSSRTLSHAELVVLGLLEAESAHAYELVQRIRDMRAERWARVAESTVYSVLPRLEERGLVVGEDEPGERAASRRRYRPTATGRRELEALTAQGLEEPSILYSDRIVAGVFAAARGETELLRSGLERTAREIEALESSLSAEGLTAQGRIIIDFYLDVARAHRQALEGLEAML